ncbi:MAG: tRNA lysidine(34) synthetase TilS [Phycisphaerae bacterium]
MTTPDPERQFVERVLDTITRYDLLPREAPADAAPEPVVVGVSGGPDSVALAHVLERLRGGRDPVTGRRRPRRLAVDLVLAHLHHGLRGAAAEADADLVADLADRLHLPYVVERADIRAAADARGVGVEEAGRDARRRFFIRTARRHGARKVALGHHGGDRIETVLFHILRGTGIDGLATLGPRASLAPEEGVEIVRPMVHPYIGRGLVLAYLERTGLDWHEDETNDDPAYTRNRLRHEVLPLLGRAVNPAVEEALFRLADQAEAARTVLDEALDRVWSRVVREVPAPDVISTEASRSEAERSAVPRVPAGNLAVGKQEDDPPRRDSSGPQAGPQNDSAGGGPRALLIDADDFAALAPWLQGALVRRAVARLGGGLKHMSAARTEEVVSALVAKTVAGPVDLPDGLTAERRRRIIRIGPRRRDR